MKLVLYILLGVIAALPSLATAAAAPQEIKIGTEYSSSGDQTLLGMTTYMGLKLWVDNENAKGGVFVKPYGKRVKVKLIAYDNQSDTATAATLYNQLITQDKVNILVASGGSLLTSPAVPLAREHKILLIDQNGSGFSFFSPNNPYIVLTSTPISTLWPRSAAEFLAHDGPKLGIKRVAMIYSTNSAMAGMASTLREAIEGSHGEIKLVADKAVPIDTSNYTVLIHSILAKHPDAVVEFGYPGNDVAFLRDLQSSGIHFKWLYCNYPGFSTEHMIKTVGVKAMQYTYTLALSSVVNYKVNSGMTSSEFQKEWNKTYHDNKVAFSFNSIAGYTTGVVLQDALAITKSLQPLDLRKAIFSLSGKLKTLDGAFILAKDGAQTGEVPPLAQLIPNGKGGMKFVTVYPPAVADGKPIYPAPK